MNKFVYKIVKIIAEGKSDENVVSRAEKVINEHASSGWKLHTYSYVAADTGSFTQGFLGQTTLTNLLHLVFERERPMREAEKEATISVAKAENDMEKRKADAFKSQEKFRNEKKNEQS